MTDPFLKAQDQKTDPFLGRVLVLVVAGLGAELVRRFPLRTASLSWSSLEGIFPSLTSPAQVSLRTGLPVEEHGFYSNGVYRHDLSSIQFWEQSAHLIRTPERIWTDFRNAGGRVGMLFWQQSLGESVDWTLSPRPIHTPSGGLVQNLYSHPYDLAERVVNAVGRPFKLHHYWGPVACGKASDWIADALTAVLKPEFEAPELLFSYLPHLDYILQREGPNAPGLKVEMERLDRILDQIQRAAEDRGYALVVTGDYAIHEVEDVCFPNRWLARNGLFEPMVVQGRQYAELFDAQAFAMVDHQIAVVPVRNPEKFNEVKSLFESESQVDSVQVLPAVKGEPPSLLLTAAEGCWFAYPWWETSDQAPLYARKVDIHNKPGFDPCELFFGWPPGTVSQNPSRMKGSHGRGGPGCEVAVAASHPSLLPADKTLTGLAHQIRSRLR